MLKSFQDIAKITLLLVGSQITVAAQGLNVSQTTTVVDNVECFSIQFYTDSGWEYTLQNLQENGVWEDSIQFSGIDDQITVPLIPVTGPGTGASQSSLPTQLIKIQKVATGGVLLHWSSPQSGELVSYFDSTIPSFLSTSINYPPFSHQTLSHYFLIVTTGPEFQGTPPTNPPLTGEDLIIFQDFQSTYSDLSQPPAGNNVVLNVQATGSKSIIRVKARIADSDRDGIYDYRELANGTDPNSADTDGDGVRDGMEVATKTDPNDPDDPTPTSSSGGGGGGPNLEVMEVKIEEVSFFGNHELTNDPRSVTYRNPHWVREINNFPISYKRSDTLQLSAKFFISPAPANPTVLLAAPNGITLISAPLTKVENTENLYELKKTPCQGSLPDVVRLYGKPPQPGEDREFFDIEWKVTLSSPTVSFPEFRLLETKHTLYLTHDKPPFLPIAIGPYNVWTTPREESTFFLPRLH